MKRERGGKVIIRPSPSAASASAADDLVVVGEYEVFLNFCGKDTRYGFTDYLYNDLVSAGVRTFRDDNELRVGEEIGPELLRAINESKISISIFSKKYADSKWCLRELAQMVECKVKRGQMIYPIFYDVDPSSVQHQKGSYKKAFRNHRKSVDEETTKQWMEALEIVGELKGLELKKETNMHEGELVKIVVEEILSKLKKSYKHVPENLVGMDSHIEEMERLLNIDSNGIRIIGILGMGGLGKTTIAKLIYNQVCELFECHCFLEDVRENSNSNAIVKLQNQLVSQILKRESKFDDVNQGIDKIKSAIHRKKVLIVLDDVDKKFQIDKLAGNHSWYETGSRIIITTRNEEVLLALEMTCQNEGLHELYRCYKPKLMVDNLALQLFSKYAFMRDSPPEGYEDLAIEVIRTAGGLPLVLVTLGSLLFIEKDKVLWHEKLKKLKAMPPLEVLGRLRISYDALDNAQKQIFLDIACLFSGVDKINPCYMWDDCKFYPCEGLNALIRRSLITVGDYNKLWMHDQLRELGMQIICEENWDEPGKWSRLWRYEDASSVLKTHHGTQNVKVLSCLHSSVFQEIVDFDILVGQDFGKLPNLRYLSIDSDLDGDFKNLLQNLRWLQWRRFPGYCAPTNLLMKNLVVLNLSFSGIRDDWGGWSQIKMSNKLKVLSFSHCSGFTRIPHLSSAFPTLERLELVGCESLCRLDGLEELKLLKYLNAAHCRSLESLPDLSKLTRLQTLNVELCEKLTEIQGLDQLVSLEILNTSSCEALERLPNLSNLEKLTRFQSSWCKKLVEIQGLDRLASLEHLNISGCESLNSLPDLSHLKRLKNLNISRCKKLVEIRGLDRLISLELLNIRSCESLKRLPDLSNLKRLRKLIGGGLELTEVQGLGGLESLEHLNMNGWENIERLSELSKLRRLRELEILSCHKLIEIQGLGRLESLEHLNMKDLVHIERLSDLSKLRWLRELKISSCYKLIEIQGLDGLESLELFYLSNCLSIKSILGMSNLKRLKNLHISRCKKLIEIKDLDGLESLEILDMYECESLKRLPDLSNLKKLRCLDISVCYMLVEIQCLDGLESLEILNMSECESLKRLPDLSNLKKLKSLDLSFCYMLVKIQGLYRLESLERLDMRYCKSIEILPDLLNFGLLKHLSLHNCKRLQNVETLRVVESLESLYASSCETLDLPMFKNLKKLEICYLEKLTELQGLEELKSLAWLNVSGCKSIENLPDVSNLANLKVLDVSFCVKLTEIRGLEELKFLRRLRIVGCESLENLPYLPTTDIQDIYEDEESLDYLSDMSLEQKSQNNINRSFHRRNFHRRLRDISKYRLVHEVSSYVGSMEET